MAVDEGEAGQEAVLLQEFLTFLDGHRRFRVELVHNSLDHLQVLREPTSCLNPGPLPGCDRLRGERPDWGSFQQRGGFQEVLFGAGDKAVDILVCVPHLLTHPVQSMGEAGDMLRDG